jgi:universal stress protein E
MLRAILDCDPDLTLKSVHHESALRRLFFTPEDWYLARLSPAPLLVVAGRRDLIPRHVLAAVDPTSEDENPSLDRRIVDAAGALASACRAELHLAYVSEPIAEIMADANMVGGVTTMGLSQQLEEDREAAFKAFADRLEIPLATRHFRRGRVDRVLSELADQLGACVIVVGSNYRSGMERFFLGSTSEDLLANARHDVLVVKPEGFSDRFAEAGGKLPG